MGTEAVNQGPFWRRGSLPPTLFHYRSLKASKDFDEAALGYLANMLAEGVIYLPRVSEFNDPFEAHPQFTVPARYRSPEEAIVQFLIRMNPEGGDTSPWRAALEADCRRQVAEIGLDRVMHLMQAQFAGLMSQQLIFCLSEQPTDVLMWSHYGRKHTGVVVEFSTGVAPFTAAQRAIYSRKYPSIDVSRVLEPMHALRQSLLVKAHSWKHEREWRVLGMRAPGVFEWDARQPPEGSPGRYVRIPKAAIRRIIIGARVSPGTSNRIRLLAQRAEPPVQVAVCKLAAREYRVGVIDDQ